MGYGGLLLHSLSPSDKVKAQANPIAISILLNARQPANDP